MTLNSTPIITGGQELFPIQVSVMVPLYRPAGKALEFPVMVRVTGMAEPVPVVDSAEGLPPVRAAETVAVVGATDNQFPPDVVDARAENVSDPAEAVTLTVVLIGLVGPA
jgi:hypothetical protein